MRGVLGLIKPGDIVLDEKGCYYLILKKGKYGKPLTLGFQMLPIANTVYEFPSFWPNKPVVIDLKEMPLNCWDSIKNLNNKKYYKKIVGER